MLSPVAVIVRRCDPDRFLTALFAPAARRETVFLLYAFNHELARAREVASDPTLALIRLQWWREVVDGVLKRHEIATPLSEAMAAGLLRRDFLHAMIDAREAEASPAIPNFAAWLGYVLGTAGSLAMAAGGALGADDDQLNRLRLLGGAYAVAGILRSNAFLARQARCLLPEDLLASQGLSLEAAMAAPDSPALRPVRAALREAGIEMLHEGARTKFPRKIIAAALPATLARRDFKHDDKGAPRLLGDRVAVMWAWMKCQV